ncbi:head maturation protease [Arthrobacter phage SilentRX]|uniref:Capsid maturation protease and MuF-like fusion protein n=1 Tax=Arthrobacter phage SilentRX TaxID=2836091 RepID=A0A8F3IL49_9CAUD|nr:head maturation protease [Arthrobacter phage SilentRX]QWY82761.1 capsid maturation protease and MuF-like fusion protein [Arthrobacter phage SilentRX]
MIRKESFTVSADTFAAERKKIVADNDTQLRPHVAEALARLGLPSWERQIVSAALDIFDVTARAEVDEWTPVLDDLRDAFAKELGDTLAKTGRGQSLEGQIDTLTRWVSTAAHNAGMEAAATSDTSAVVGLEWVTMGDGDVRHSHREANGQTVPSGQEFTVGEVKMLYPGQPVGDPSNWINCRCLARPTMLDEAAGKTLTASAEEPSTSATIMALPAETDPVSGASSEADGAHCTLLFLGNAAALDRDALAAALERFVTGGQVGVMTEKVAGRATLGPNKADVALIDGASLVNIRNGLLEDNTIVQAFQSVEQYPTWIPHVTLGYPETPASAEFTGESITFDRLALWFGEDRTAVYPLGEAMPAQDQPEQPAAKEKAVAAMRALTAAATGAEDPVPGAVAPTAEEDQAMKDFDEEMASLDGADAFTEVPWYGVLAPEGTPSGDGRMFSPNALTNRPLPLPLKFMWEDDEGHKGSYPIGRIDRIWRENGLIKAEGMFDTSEAGYEAIRLLANQIMRGVSVDLDAAELAADGDGETMEFSTGRICSATICAIPAFAEAFVAIGTWADSGTAAPADNELPDSGVGAPTPAGQAQPDTAVAAGETQEFDIPPVKTMDGPGWITDPKPTHKITSYWVDGRGAAKIGWGVPGDFNRCRANLGKYVQNPSWLAGLCANLHYRALGVWPGAASAETVEMHQEIGPAVSLVASAVPVISADYFRNPQLTENTPVTLGEDGHIFGHLGTWDTCHIAYEVCTTIPPSETDYAYFLTGQVFTDAGPVAVGQLTVGGGHAGGKLGVRAAIAHYDNVATAVADITVGEDAFGVWFSGRVRPWATEQQLHELFASGPSGDWRPVRARGRSSMELVAAHAVNVQGFPVPRARATVENGQQLSLIAAGVPQRDGYTLNDRLKTVNTIKDSIRAQRFAFIGKKLSETKGR